MMLFAVDPEHPIERDAQVKRGGLHLLQPANYGYQFTADSNEAAEKRIQNIVDWIVAGQLSPDTDFRTFWDTSFFADAVSLYGRGRQQ